METGERNGQQELMLSLNNRVSENKKTVLLLGPMDHAIESDSY